MVRGLYSAWTGMQNEQKRLDVIANNLANSATVGYKKEGVTSQAFDDELAIKIRDASVDWRREGIGTMSPGVKIGEVYTDYRGGSLRQTGNTFDFAIDGDGFFAVRMPDGTTAYTRNGSFGLARNSDGSICIANSEGYQLLDDKGAVIRFEATQDTAQISIDANGNICYPDAKGNSQPTGVKIGLTQFNNPAGLLKIHGSLFQVTEASGAPRLESTDTALKQSRILTKYLEASNVHTADEIVNLIVTQRAYEMNSKVINASDEMLQQANNLRG